MSRGLAYDSEEGRNLASAITALQSGHCYFADRAETRSISDTKKESCLSVMRVHRDAISPDGKVQHLLTEARKSWDNTVEWQPI